MSQFNVSDDTKKAILSQRLVELNAEGYNNEIALTQAEAIKNSEQIAYFEANIQAIKLAIKTLEEELGKLD